jgi:Spy/CpxP family protein refolding chaperone
VNNRSMIVAAIVAVIATGLAAPAGYAQNAPPSPTADLGQESGNWGLAPFSAVPAIALRPEDRTAIRTLEDQQIRERRAFEDKYEGELRTLMQKHADEREALRARLSNRR